MKNRKGSVLVLVFMVFVVLSILAITSISLMLTNNNQALAHRNKIQAYYIARGGAEAVEAAILSIKNEKEKENLLKSLPKAVEINGMNFENGNLESVILKKEEDTLMIESKGKVGQSFEIVNKVMEIEKNTSAESGSVEDSFDLALFSNTNMIFEANAQNNIIGNIGTNSLENNAIKFISGYNKNITIKIPLGADPSKIIEKPVDNKDIPDIEYIEKRNYSPYEFPEYPSNLINRGSIKTNWNNSNPIIGLSAYYEELVVESNRSVTVDATTNDIILRVKDFNVSQGGINISGNKNVKIFIENFISLKGEVNKNKINKNVEIYYNGDKDISIMNETKINGSIYLKNAGFNLGGGGLINGNIISGGRNILINGGSHNHGLIYSPNADVVISGGGGAEGAIICNSFKISGGGYVNYNSDSIDSEFIKFPSVEEKVTFKKAYYK